MKAKILDVPADVCAVKRSHDISFLGNTYYLPPEDSNRNAPCPCGSGKKYKRCCGKDVVPKKTKKIYLTAAPIEYSSNVVGIALCEDGRVLVQMTASDVERAKHHLRFHRREYERACPFGYELEWVHPEDVEANEDYMKALALWKEGVKKRENV